MTPRPYTFDRVVRIILAVVAIIGIFLVLRVLKGALLPFVAAWLLAYLLNPIVLFCQNRLRIRNRILAIITTLLTLGAIFTIVGFTVVPSVVSEIEKTSEVIKGLSQSSQFGPIVEKSWYKSFIDKLSLDEVDKFIDKQEWIKFLEESLTNIWGFVSSSISHIISIIGWFIVLLYLVFILLDYSKIINGFKGLIPERYREITLSILSDVEEGMSKYFRGQALVALCVGVLFTIGFMIVGLPLAIPLGLFIGLLNMVPYLQIVGIIPTIILCFIGSFDSSQSFWVLLGFSTLVFVVVQLIQDIFIVPKIMGKVTGLNPAVILLSLSIWGSLLGMLGMIIALPLTSLLLAYYRKYILNRER